MYQGSSGGYGTSGGMAYGSAYSAQKQDYFSSNHLYAHSIDSVVNSASIERREPVAIPNYVPSSAKGAYLTSHTPHDYFTADTFLKPGSTARFVGDAEEIANDIKEAFTATTGEELPADIVISVLNDRDFKQAHIAHDGSWSEGVMGFSLNSNGRGVNQVFVRAAPLDHLMLTVGHEIGHVLTQSLGNAHDEEAKAFAFSLAWMDAIKTHNIAGIGANILPEPAHNGLHDRAFAFVQNIMDAGTSAWNTFLQLANGTVTITRQIETVEV
jgi:hypothetical protein